MVLNLEFVLLPAVLGEWYVFSSRNALFLRIFAYFCSPFLKKIINVIKNRYLCQLFNN